MSKVNCWKASFILIRWYTWNPHMCRAGSRTTIRVWLNRWIPGFFVLWYLIDKFEPSAIPNCKICFNHKYNHVQQCLEKYLYYPLLYVLTPSIKLKHLVLVVFDKFEPPTMPNRLQKIVIHDWWLTNAITKNTVTYKIISYMCMYACMHVCMYVCVCVCMHACMYAFMYVCMYACMYVYMHPCMHACMYACMYVCVYIYT